MRVSPRTHSLRALVAAGRASSEFQTSANSDSMRSCESIHATAGAAFSNRPSFSVNAPFSETRRSQRTLMSRAASRSRASNAVAKAPAAWSSSESTREPRNESKPVSAAFRTRLGGGSSHCAFISSTSSANRPSFRLANASLTSASISMNRCFSWALRHSNQVSLFGSSARSRRRIEIRFLREALARFARRH